MAYDQREVVGETKAKIARLWDAQKASQNAPQAPADTCCASSTIPGPPMAGRPVSEATSDIVQGLEKRREDLRVFINHLRDEIDQAEVKADNLKAAINLLTLHPDAEVMVELLRLKVM